VSNSAVTTAVEIRELESMIWHAQVPGLMENRPSVLRGDHLFLSRSSDIADKARHVEYKGYVHEVHASQVCLGFGEKYVNHNNVIVIINTHTHTRLTALCPGLPG